MVMFSRARFSLNWRAHELIPFKRHKSLALTHARTHSCTHVLTLFNDAFELLRSSEKKGFQSSCVIAHNLRERNRYEQLRIACRARVLNVRLMEMCTHEMRSFMFAVNKHNGKCFNVARVTRTTFKMNIFCNISNCWSNFLQTVACELVSCVSLLTC